MVTPSITRREFIGTTAAAGAGLLLSSCSPKQTAAGKNSPLSKINMALIGCGEIVVVENTLGVRITDFNADA